MEYLYFCCLAIKNYTVYCLQGHACLFNEMCRVALVCRLSYIVELLFLGSMAINNSTENGLHIGNEIAMTLVFAALWI